MKYLPTQQLTVYFEQGGRKKVGRLAWHERQILFEYDREFLDSGIEVSPIKLPLKAGVVIADDNVFDGLFGVFNDSLPDGWGRLLLDRQVEQYGINRRQLNVLDRLAFVGQHGMGCLIYEPELEAVTSDIFDQPLRLDTLAAESQCILSGETDLVFPELLALNGGSSGARPKIMAQTNQDKTQIIHGGKRLQTGFEHWMIKFPSIYDVKDIAAIEYAYSLMARDAGIELPETHLFTTESGRYFGTQRFDRQGDSRIHMHSLAGLIHADHRVPSLDYDLILRIVRILTKNNQDVERAFSLACFNVLAHNRDDHSKNFSFILDNDFQWKLSPAYDLTFSYGPNGEHSTTIMGEGRSPSVKQLRELGKKHSLKKAEKLIEQVRCVVEKWRGYAEKTGVTEQSMNDVLAGLSRVNP